MTPSLPPAFSSDSIAIIGAAVRFPGAPTLEAYRRLLLEGRQAMRPVPAERLAGSLHAALSRQPGYVAMESTLEDIEVFDAGFFGLSPREALILDPQHRHLLECAWHAYEQAGIVPGDRDDHRTGVFTSVSHSAYLTRFLMPHFQAGRLDVIETSLANDKDYAAARLAWKLNLKGPAAAIQTACSSSLVATHMACRSLLDGECDLAVVGAATITVPSGLGYPYSEKGILSRDGRCRPFAADASGTLFASGVAVILLKRLEEAHRDQDRVLACIRGSAVNNDGGQRAGFTAPNVDGQSAVIAEALAVAGVDPGEIQYVEGHGTATPLGDPVEVTALTDAFTAGSPLPPGQVALGSVKGNLGHLDTVAGLAGLLKVALALEAETLLPTPHAATPNPALNLPATPFRLVPAAEPWRRGPRRRLASVSSFGMGGTNAHAVVEEAPLPLPPAPGREVELLVFSARTAEDATAVADRLADHLSAHPALSLTDVAHTLRVGRTALADRRMLVAASLPEAVEALRTGRYARSRIADTPPPAVLVFPGQGSQYPGLAADLLDRDPLFSRHFQRLRGRILMAGGPDVTGPESRTEAVHHTALAQPLLFVTQMALALTLLDLGLKPALLIGHSVGEIAAACLSGRLKEDGAARLVVCRARAMAAAPAGAMLLLSADTETTRRLITLARRDLSPERVLELAAFNATGAVVAGGDQAAIAALEQTARQDGISCTRLHTSHAFHTALMDGAATAVSGLTLPPVDGGGPLRVISTLTGTVAGPDMGTTAYWADQIRQPVRFADALQTALDLGGRLFIEVGAPGGLEAALQALSRQTDSLRTVSLLPSRRAATQPDAARRMFLSGIGTLWLSGHDPDWARLDQPFLPRQRVDLPGYPFRKERHWPERPDLRETEEQQLPSLFADGEASPESIGQTALADRTLPTGFVLPRQPRPAESPAYDSPQGDLEHRLASLWEEFLLIAPIGRNDNFLALGGSSITALQVVQALSSDGTAITVRDLFSTPTLTALATHVAAKTVSPSPQDAPAAPAPAPVDAESMATIAAQLLGTA